MDIAPGLVAGVIWTKGLDQGSLASGVPDSLRAAEKAVAERVLDPPEIARLPSIAAWREVYSRLGLKPNRYPCAAESLIRRVVTGGTVPEIHGLVDLCNSVSLRLAVPVAPFDLSRVVGDCVVRRATGGEIFRTIGSADTEAVPAGEAVYADGTSEVLSRRWNWRQTAKGAVRPGSSDFLITTEAVHAGAAEAIDEAVDLLCSGIENSFGGRLQAEILSSDSPWSERPPDR